MYKLIINKAKVFIDGASDVIEAKSSQTVAAGPTQAKFANSINSFLHANKATIEKSGPNGFRVNMSHVALDCKVEGLESDKELQEISNIIGNLRG